MRFGLHSKRDVPVARSRAGAAVSETRRGKTTTHTSELVDADFLVLKTQLRPLGGRANPPRA